jgi:hypothetical protein
VKRWKVLELVRRERVEVLALQETKLELVMGNLCVKHWGEFRSGVGFCFFRFVKRLFVDNVGKGVFGGAMASPKFKKIHFFLVK